MPAAAPLSSPAVNTGVVPRVLDGRMAVMWKDAAKWTAGASALTAASIGIWKFGVVSAIASQSLPAIGGLACVALAGAALIAGASKIMNSHSSSGNGTGIGVGLAAIGLGAVGALTCLAPISFPVLGVMAGVRAIKADTKVVANLIHKPESQVYAQLSLQEQSEVIGGLGKKLSTANLSEREEIYSFIAMAAAQGDAASRSRLDTSILQYLRNWGDADAEALYERLVLTLPYAPQSDYNHDQAAFETTKIAFDCIDRLRNRATPEQRAVLVAKLAELRPTMGTASDAVKGLFKENTQWWSPEEKAIIFGKPQS